MRPYTDFEGFEHVYLEDSFVLDVAAHPGLLVVTLEVKLTADHPRFRAPPPSEAGCFVDGHIHFRGVRRLTWLTRDIRPARDASGTIDFGGINYLARDGAGSYVLQGDFGELDIEATACTIELVPEDLDSTGTPPLG